MDKKIYSILQNIFCIGLLILPCVLYPMYSSTVRQFSHQQKNPTFFPMVPFRHLSDYKKFHSPNPKGLLENRYSLDVNVACSYKNIGANPVIKIDKITGKRTVSGISFNTGSDGQPALHIESNMYIGLGWYTDSTGKMHPALSIENADKNGLFCIAINAKQLANPASWIRATPSRQPTRMPSPNTFTNNGIGSNFLASCKLNAVGEKPEITMTPTDQDTQIIPGFVFAQGDAPLLQLSAVMQASFGIYRNEQGRLYPSFSLLNRDKTGAVCIAINPEKLIPLSEWRNYLAREQSAIEPYIACESDKTLFYR